MIVALPDAEGILQLQNLRSVPGVRHGFATRRGRLEDVLAGPIARLHQVHGADVLALPADPRARQPFFEAMIEERPPADALITDAAGIAVAVAVADCLPILMADREAGVAAAVHAGWRGLAGGVIENAVGTLVEDFGAKTDDLVVGIGPAIGRCCFEVGPEVIEAFAERGYGPQAGVSAAAQGSAPTGVGGGAASDRTHCDLGAVAMAILIDLGVPSANVAVAGLCTKCNSDWLWSYRRDGELAGRMICGIALAEA